MTATTIPADVAVITNHDEWVAFYSAPQNISDFAAEQIGESEVGKAADGDYYAQEYVASQVSNIARLEAMTDEQLRAEHAESEASHRRVIEMDDVEYDVNDYESFYYQQGLIEALLDHRRIRRSYTGHGPLTHNPFAALAAVS